MFFNDAATTEIYTLSLHDALPILSELTPSAGRSKATTGSPASCSALRWLSCPRAGTIRRPSTRRCVRSPTRSEEHTSELQSRQYLVCRLLLEKKQILVTYIFLSLL